MADPPPNAEPGRCIASLSQLIFHLHSGLGSTTPQDALDALLTALQGALPSFGVEQRESIQGKFSETLGTNEASFQIGRAHV